jgi:hypothetical protein
LVAQRRSLSAIDRDLAAHSLLATGEQAARLMIEDPEEYPPERLIAFAEVVLRELAAESPDGEQDPTGAGGRAE